jgi:hypothetical protein
LFSYRKHVHHSVQFLILNMNAHRKLSKTKHKSKQKHYCSSISSHITCAAISDSFVITYKWQSSSIEK